MASQPHDLPPRLITFTICDDVRVEKDNKFTLVGVYSRSIALQTMPFTFPKISFFAQFDSLALQNRDLIVRLVNPSGAVVFETRGKLPAATEASPFPPEFRDTTVVFHLAPFTLTESGLYSVHYEASDWPPYRVEFFVALRQQAESAPVPASSVQ